MPKRNLVDRKNSQKNLIIQVEQKESMQQMCRKYVRNLIDRITQTDRRTEKVEQREIMQWYSQKTCQNTVTVRRVKYIRTSRAERKYAVDIARKPVRNMIDRISQNFRRTEQLENRTEILIEI